MEREGWDCQVRRGDGRGSIQISGSELLPCAVADVENFHYPLRFHDAVYHTIDMGMVAIKQVPKVFAFGRGR
jgi:hypothetical protein